ncbi:MAG: thioredoxin family protein [Candidatus Zhuqueibacterota bacterium]
MKKVYLLLSQIMQLPQRPQGSKKKFTKYYNHFLRKTFSLFYPLILKNKPSFFFVILGAFETLRQFFKLHNLGLLVGLWILFAFACGKNDAQTTTESSTKVAQTDSVKIDSTKTDSTQASTPKVTFVELGSVNCVPCKMMQPVMKAIEEEFGDQIEIVFHDVWKDRAPAEKYRIRIIPTQVFLDESGKEFLRHEGYFPKEEIEKLLTDKGLKKKNPIKPNKS